VHYVYILRSAKDGNLYTGYSADLRKPLADHNAGKRYIRKQLSHYLSAAG
jgi:predicted GIY-YIG superfamily endonuclease